MEAQAQDNPESLIIDEHQKEVVVRTLELIDNKQINLNQMSLEHLVVDMWHSLREVLCMIQSKEQIQ